MPDMLLPAYDFPLIVFDLEWNQRYGHERSVLRALPQEIVEIGAVKIGADFEISGQCLVFCLRFGSLGQHIIVIIIIHRGILGKDMFIGAIRHQCEFDILVIRLEL